MRRLLLLSLLFAATIPVIALPLSRRLGAQDGVFVGSGRVERRGARDEHASRNRSYTDEDLRPREGERSLRDVESLEQQCLDEVNRQRSARGLKSLEWSEDLLDVARYYSRRMALERFFSHTDPEGRTVRQRVSEAGIEWRVLGENLAYSNGYTNPVAVSVRGWMESPGHRRNILDPAFRHTAIGVWINNKGTVYFTEIFLR